MIVEQMVPEIYYKDSRDFAYIGRLFEIIFNYMKTAADNVNVEPKNDNIDSNIIDLLVNTLGFIPKHTYNVKDLVFIASSFSEMLRNKGSIYAIELAIKTLLASQNIRSEVGDRLCERITDGDKYKLIMYLPGDMTDIILLDDLMDYILPAGMLYKYEKVGSNVIDTDSSTVKTALADNYEILSNVNTSRIYSIPSGEDDIYTRPNDSNIGTIYTGTSADSYIYSDMENSHNSSEEEETP